jgi:hypothetical protein
MLLSIRGSKQQLSRFLKKGEISSVCIYGHAAILTSFSRVLEAVIHGISHFL